jgi:putative hydrolase of the HAD superfamily
MDDTLYDEIDYCRSAFTACAKYIVDNLHGPEPMTTEAVFMALWTQFNAGNQKKTFNTALEKFEIQYDTETIKALVSAYREHTPAIELPADSRTVLDTLSPKYRMAMLTDGFLPAQELKVAALGIEKYFEYIVFTEQLGREFWKPSPAGFQKILEKFGEKPENCIYIADNAEKDFIAPNQLGMHTIQLIREKRVHKAQPEGEMAEPKQKIDAITVLPPLLEEL